MDKVVAKNEKNSAKSEGGLEVDKSGKSESYIGWRSDIIQNNKIGSDALNHREANGYSSAFKEKENLTGSSSSKEVISHLRKSEKPHS